MEFDDFLGKINGLGPFQKRAGVLLCLTSFPICFHMLAVIFTAATPAYFCKATDFWPNATISSKMFSLDDEILVNTTNGTSVRLSRCSVDITSAFGIGNTTESLPCAAWEYNKSWYDFTIANQWDLICDREWLVATAGSLFLVGFLVGSFVFGIISDMFGRKTPFLLATLAQLVVGVSTAFSPDYTTFVVFQVLNGVVTSGQNITSFVLSMELAGNTGRLIIGLFSTFVFGVAYLSLTGLAFLVREWWKLQLILTIPSALTLSYYFLIPESPRWLLLHDRKDQARDTMKKMAKMNGFPDVDVNSVEIQKYEKSTRTYLDLFRTPTLRIRTLSVGFIWMTNSLVYFGLTFNTGNLAGNPYVNHAIGASTEGISALVCIWLFEKVGRRLSQLGALLLCGLTLLAILIVPGDFTTVITALSMTGKFLISGSFAMLYVYTAEVFPTVVRNQAVGWGSISARIGSISAPFIAQLGNSSILIPFITFGICSIVSAALMLLVMPETKGVALADNIQQGEHLGSTARARKIPFKPPKTAESQHEPSWLMSDDVEMSTSRSKWDPLIQEQTIVPNTEMRMG